KVEASPDYGVNLSHFRLEPGRLVLLRSNVDDIVVPLDADGNFEMSAFFGTNLPAGIPQKAKPFTVERVWHMGIELAARELTLDLDKAEIDLEAGRITLRGPQGIE